MMRMTQCAVTSTQKPHPVTTQAVRLKTQGTAHCCFKTLHLCSIHVTVALGFPANMRIVILLERAVLLR